MWHANITRRQVLELVLSGDMPKVSRVDDVRDAAVGGENPFDVFWARKPDGSVGDLPVLMLVDDDSLQDVIAMLASSPQVPSPFTAFCRVIPRSWTLLLNQRAVDARVEVIYGLTGLALAEAAIYAGGAIRVADISPAICRRTLSFVFGRALSQLSAEALPLVINRWLQTHSVLGLSTPGFDKVSKALLPILDLGGRAFLGLPPESPLTAVTAEMVEFGEPSEGAWQELSGRYLKAPSLKFFAESTREQRSSAFQDIVKGMFANNGSNVPDEAVACCALAGTRISPGTFDHLNLLSMHPDVRLPLWYAFFAALQRRGAALRVGSASALRVMRDMNQDSQFHSSPSADISAEELDLVYRKSTEQLGRRLSHSNEIIVEVFPGIDASFRFGQRSDRKEASIGNEAGRAAVEKTPAEKIDAARRLLEELSRDISKLSTVQKAVKSVKKKPTKSDRLF